MGGDVARGIEGEGVFEGGNGVAGESEELVVHEGGIL